MRWVAESYRPFAIAKDPGFLRLMLSGRPTYYIPSPTTISRDLKLIFAIVRKRLSRMLQVSDPFGARRAQRTHHAGCNQDYAGRLHFATDSWTSPNHRPFVAFTVHLELNGAALKILLDIVELSKVRLFAWVLEMRSDCQLVVTFWSEPRRDVRGHVVRLGLRGKGQSIVSRPLEVG